MNRRACTIGLVVNPVAGLGGAAGLHGSDGPAIQRLAVQRHGTSDAAGRTRRFLAVVDEDHPPVHWLVAPGIMGADQAAAPHRSVTVVPAASGRLDVAAADRDGNPTTSTTAEDTKAAVRAMVAGGADLIVFAGGDGTARDVAAAVGDALPMLGIPTGVKMQSAVFGVSPESAAHAVLQWLRGVARVTRADIIDLDEVAYRSGTLGSTIFGSVTTIAAPRLVVGRKVGSTSATSVGTSDIAAAVRARLDDEAVWLLGPGSTVQELAACWGLSSSLLGVDVVDNGRMVARDVSAGEIAELCGDRRVQVVLSPIGGQGFLLGRGNQQIGVALSGRLAATDLLVVATEEKLAGLADGCLYLDAPTAGPPPRFLRVITGRHGSALVPVVIG